VTVASVPGDDGMVRRRSRPNAPFTASTPFTGLLTFGMVNVKNVGASHDSTAG
jgi:hypothetical protein